MSAIEIIEVDGVVEKPDYKGFKVKGAEKLYYLSKRLVEQGVSLSGITPGMKLEADIYTSDRGGKYINSYRISDGAAAPVANGNGAVASQPDIAKPAAASSKPPFKKQWGGGKKEDALTKEEWAKKDIQTYTSSIWKSTLESPSLSNAFIGQPTTVIAEGLATIAEALTERFFKDVKKHQG